MHNDVTWCGLITIISEHAHLRACSLSGNRMSFGIFRPPRPARDIRQQHMHSSLMDKEASN